MDKQILHLKEIKAKSGTSLARYGAEHKASKLASTCGREKGESKARVQK
jgi:hypothetical protein